jgi:hypothetical protein
MIKMFGIAATAHIVYSISYIVKNDSKTQYDLRTTIYVLCAMLSVLCGFVRNIWIL